MPRSGNINPSNPNAEIFGDIFAGRTPTGYSFGVPVSVARPLHSDATVRGFQCPLDSACAVSVVVDVRTADATETIDVGVANAADSTSDTLLDGQSVAAVGLYPSGVGTNGSTVRKINPSQFVTWDPSAGTDTLEGYIVMTFTPIGA